MRRPVTRAALLAATLALPLGAAAGGCARFWAFGAAGERAEAQYREGVGEEARGDLREAEDCYEDALDFDPNHARTLARLGQIRTRQAKYHDAIPLLQRSVKVTGGSPDALNDLAYCYAQVGYAAEAEATYARGLEVDPAHARLRSNYGLLLAGQGRLDDAMTQLRQAMSEADAHHNVALVLREQGKHAEARESFRRSREAAASTARANAQ
jgi:tetratricopeptide (TPR) repeat protein